MRILLERNSLRFFEKIKILFERISFANNHFYLLLFFHNFFSFFFINFQFFVFVHFCPKLLWNFHTPGYIIRPWKKWSENLKLEFSRFTVINENSWEKVRDVIMWRKILNVGNLLSFSDHFAVSGSTVLHQLKICNV
jgi:hypothetical protein